MEFYQKEGIAIILLDVAIEEFKGIYGEFKREIQRSHSYSKMHIKEIKPLSKATYKL